jgi:hypothetical protein
VATVIVYFLLSFLLGLYTCGGVGVSVNAWFDFFMAAAIVYGVFAATEPGLEVPPWLKPLAYTSILCGIAGNEFVVRRFISPDGILEDTTLVIIRLWQCMFLLAGMALLVSNYSPRVVKTLLFTGILAMSLFIPLKGSHDRMHPIEAINGLYYWEQVYHRDVQSLKSMPGPALFENPLVGFDAGKRFLFDSFAASQLIVAGRIREDILIERIRDKYFGAIVLVRNLNEMLTELGKMPKPSDRAHTTVTDRWTDKTLVAIKENYHPVHLDYLSRFYFYSPDSATNQ